MNIYLIKRTDLASFYNVYDSAIVVAPDIETARNMHPYDGRKLCEITEKEWRDIGYGMYYKSWTRNAKVVDVELIGTTAKNKCEVILASYTNA